MKTSTKSPLLPGRASPRSRVASSWRRVATGTLAAVALACAHAEPQASAPSAAPEKPPDPRELASAISAETRAMLRSEGDLLWQRWTTGAGPAPSSAASGHERLFEKGTLDTLAQAQAASADPDERRALSLLASSLGPQAIARGAGDASAALELARAQLVFAAPGDAKAERSERELDRLLTDEPLAQRRAAIADAEAAAAAPLAPLALAFEKKEDEVRAQLGLPPWAQMIADEHGRTPEELAQLAEATLSATQELAARAVAAAAERNLGQPLDRLHRADLPRLVRATEADAELAAGKGWDDARATFASLGVDPLALPADAGKLRVDAEPSPAKGSRPLALLVDPPADVRLSLKNTGGFDEERALLHETARALGGALTRTPRWEMAQLGDGSAAEAIAWLAESLSGDPAWLREHTSLRGEPLDDLVHTEATRRLLAVRRAAALVLFEVQRRSGPQTVESDDALYRSLLTRATFAQHGEREGGRWPLETDGWMRAAVSLRAALLGAAIASASAEENVAAQTVGTPTVGTQTVGTQTVSQTIATPTIGTQNIGTPTTSAPAAEARAPGAPEAPGAADRAPPSAATAPAWWRSPRGADVLRKLWAQGRALGAEQAASQLGLRLEPAALVKVLAARVDYLAPEKPPAAQRPDYKFMQGDRRTRHRAHKKKKKAQPAP